MILAEQQKETDKYMEPDKEKPKLIPSPFMSVVHEAIPPTPPSPEFMVAIETIFRAFGYSKYAIFMSKREQSKDLWTVMANNIDEGLIYSLEKSIEAMKQQIRNPNNNVEPK